MTPQIFYPVKPFSINQHFGDNAPCVKDFGLATQDIEIPLIGPNGQVCPLGYEKLYPKFGMKGHNGTDLHCGEQPVYASMDGVVVEKQSVPARGLGLGVLSLEPYTFTEGFYYLKLRYWHLKSFSVEVGDTVKVGDQIGVTDNTGFSSGNHLHFEGQLMDKDSGGHPVLVQLNNGYANAINIEPYFNGKYASDKGFKFTRNLYFGLRNDDTKELQKRLNVVPTTGFFGPLTLKAVVKYQQSQGITPTGFVGPQTRLSLNK